jgi:hypothetical protein
MYLKKITIENTGPISQLQIEMPFNSDGTPQPSIFVGRNGSGKTALLSYIVDALYEFGKQAYEDLLPYTDQRKKKAALPHPYYIPITPLNRKLGTDYYGVSFQFSHHTADAQTESNAAATSTPTTSQKHLWYLEGGGTNIESFKQRFEDTINALKLPVSKEEPTKSISSDKALFEKVFTEEVMVFFPAHRFEIPLWFNSSSFTIESPIDSKRFSGILNKSIIAETSLRENKQWLLDVLMDAKADIFYDTENNQIQNYFQYQALGPVLPSVLTKKVIEEIIGVIVGQGEVELFTYPRQTNWSRISIGKRRKQQTEPPMVIIPSLESLSAGQSTLLNIFATILRYTESKDLYKAMAMNTITGIVLIDEVDLHLHSDLQYNVLPELIKLFPKVQFIITTHSPLFLLGMEKLFGPDGFKVFEMPTGEEISVEEFREFESAFQMYSDTSRFETLKKELLVAQKPVVYVEGTNDVKFIHKASILLGKESILESIELKYTGSSSIHNKIWEAAENVHKTKDQELFPIEVLLLYDCDVQKENAPSERSIGKTTKKFIPRQTDHPLQKGIENLFPRATIDKAMNFKSAMINFTSEHTKRIRDEDIVCPETLEIDKDEKTNFCEWLCQEGTVDDFAKFVIVFDTIEEFLKNISAS